MSLREAAPSEREDINTKQFYEIERDFFTYSTDIEHEIFFISDEHSAHNFCKYCVRSTYKKGQPLIDWSFEIMNNPRFEREVIECIKDAQMLFLKA